MKKHWLLAGLLALTPWAAVAQTDSVEVVDATVRVPLPGKSLTSAYFLLHNRGDQPRELVAAEADLAERAELHSHQTEDGMMKMRPVESVTVPAQGHVRFSSGGHHLMLFDLSRRPRTGDAIELVLIFADGHKETVTARAVSVYDRPHDH